MRRSDKPILYEPHAEHRMRQRGVARSQIEVDVNGTMKRGPISFEVSVSARNDGTLEAMYIRLQRGRAAKTREIIEDVLLADYDSRNRLMGLEVLAPVRLSDLTGLVDPSARPPFRRFVKRTAPKEFVAA